MNFNEERFLDFLNSEKELTKNNFRLMWQHKICYQTFQEIEFTIKGPTKKRVRLFCYGNGVYIAKNIETGEDDDFLNYFFPL